MRPVGLAVTLLLALLLPTAACQNRGREEAAGVMRALDLLRAAPNDQKRAPLEALAKVPCSLPTVCAARDHCAGVYRHLADAEDRMQAMAETLTKGPPPTAEAKNALSTQLVRAEAEIDDFRRELRVCEEAASRMRRTYGI